MNTYETILVTVPSLTDDEERTMVDGLAKVVVDGGGTLVANDRMGRRRLAFAIKKCDEGVYTRFLYDSEPTVPKELERRLGLSDRVLRYLTVRLEQDWAVSAKETAAREAQARQEAEARAAAEAAAAEAAAKEAPPQDKDGGEDKGENGDDDSAER